MPSPLLTGPCDESYQKIEKPKQPPLKNPPNIAEHVRTVSSSQVEASTAVGNSYGFTAPAKSFDTYSSVLEEFECPSNEKAARFMTMDDIMEANPYLRRADELGCCHQVPGVGYLGKFLVPPGWKEGDLPITPDEAKNLFDLDRRAAMENLDKSLAQQQNMDNGGKEELTIRINCLWKAQLFLDQIVLNERLIIYKNFHERRQNSIDRLRDKRQDLPENHLSKPQQPHAINAYLSPPASEPSCWRRVPNFQNHVDSRFANPCTPQDRLRLIIDDCRQC